MKIKLTSIFVNDQNKALKFYTNILGFRGARDYPVGKARWLTVVSPEESGGAELVLEPNDNPAAKAYQRAIFEQNVPAASFPVEDVQKEYERLKKLGVHFTQTPMKLEYGTKPTVAIFDDTCGNLILIYQGGKT